MGLLDLIRKPVIIASGILSLAGSLYAQDTWVEKICPDSGDCYFEVRQQLGNVIVGRSPNGVTRQIGNYIEGDNTEGYKRGPFITETKNGSERTSKVVYSSRTEEDNVPVNNVNNKVSGNSSVDSLVRNAETSKQAQQEFNIGKECYDRKDYQCAREHLEKAIDLDQSNTRPHWTLAQTYRSLGKDFFDKALENYYICIDKDYKKGDAYACVGSIFGSRFYHSQNKEKALEAWKTGAGLGNSFCKKNLEDFEIICKVEKME